MINNNFSGSFHSGGQPTNGPTMQGIPMPNSGFSLSPVPGQLIQQYLAINENIQQLSVFVPQHQQQVQVVNQLQQQINQQNTHLQSLSLAVQKEKKDVDKVHKPSIGNFFSKALDKHGFEKKVEKEEKEYQDAVNREQQARTHLGNLQNQMSQAQLTLSSLLGKVQLMDQKKRELEATINQILIAARLPLNHIIPQTEQNLGIQQSRRNQIVTYLNQYKTALSSLQSAYTLLQSCYERLSEAKGYATADLFMRGGMANMYVDAMKYEHLNNANADAKKAKMFIAEALRICPVLSSQPLFVAKVTNGDFVFDVMFDNFIADYIVHEKIRKSKEAMGESIRCLGNTLGWMTGTCIPQMERDLQQADQMVMSLSTTLQQERLRIVYQCMDQHKMTQSQTPQISLGIPPPNTTAYTMTTTMVDLPLAPSLSDAVSYDHPTNPHL